MAINEGDNLMKNNMWRKILGLTAFLMVTTSLGCSFKDKCNEDHMDTSLIIHTTQKDDDYIFTVDDGIRSAIREKFFEENSLLEGTYFYAKYDEIMREYSDKALLRFDDNPSIKNFISCFLESNSSDLYWLSNEEYFALLHQCEHSEFRGGIDYLLEFSHDNKKYSLKLYEEGRADDYEYSQREVVKQTVDNDKICLEKAHENSMDRILSVGRSRIYYVFQSYTMKDSENQPDSEFLVNLSCNYNIVDGDVLREKYDCNDYSATLILDNGQQQLIANVSHDYYDNFAKNMASALDEGLTVEEFLDNNSDNLTELFGDDYSSFVVEHDKPKTNVKF